MRHRSRKLLLGIAAAALPLMLQAQTLPPIFDKTPVEIAPTRMIAEYPKGTFLENVAVDGRGNVFVNSYLDGKVHRIDAEGGKSEWTAIDGTIAGIVLNPDGSAVVSGWIKGKEPAVFRVDAQGRNEVLVRLEGGMFPNGVARLAPNRFLVADSYRGVIWEVDAAAKSARIWLEHDLLARANPADPTPAVNGIKIHGGALYGSNTAKQLLFKVPVADGKAGEPEVMLKDIGLDDFDFDPAGVLYGATHVYNSLVRITPDGKVTVLAALIEGMAGSTAVAVQASNAGVQLVVATNGGMSLPPQGGVQTGKVVRVDVSPKR